MTKNRELNLWRPFIEYFLPAGSTPSTVHLVKRVSAIALGYVIRPGRSPYHVNPLNSGDVYNPKDPDAGMAGIPRNMTGTYHDG